jgi:hypothetical protein
MTALDGSILTVYSRAHGQNRVSTQRINGRSPPFRPRDARSDPSPVVPHQRSALSPRNPTIRSADATAFWCCYSPARLFCPSCRFPISSQRASLKAVHSHGIGTDRHSPSRKKVPAGPSCQLKGRMLCWQSVIESPSLAMPTAYRARVGWGTFAHMLTAREPLGSRSCRMVKRNRGALTEDGGQWKTSRKFAAPSGCSN